MKKSQFFSALPLFAAACFLAASLTSCSNDDDDDDSSSSSVTLPASSGTNELSGKNWSVTDSGTGYSESEEWEFSDSTATYTSAYSYTDSDKNETGSITETYKYTYDSENGLVYLALTKVSYTSEGTTYTWSSAAEYKKLASSVGGLTGDELADEYDSAVATFKTPVIYKYTISSTDSSLTLAEYFDGDLPTAAYFYKSLSSGSIRIKDCSIRISVYDENYNYTYYYIYPTYSDSTFTGTLYSCVEDEDSGEEVYTALGTAAGTYSTSGKGTSDCTITLTFTTVPDDASADITADSTFTLTQQSDSSTYALES